MLSRSQDPRITSLRYLHVKELEMNEINFVRANDEPDPLDRILHTMRELYQKTDAAAHQSTGFSCQKKHLIGETLKAYEDCLLRILRICNRSDVLNEEPCSYLLEG